MKQAPAPRPRGARVAETGGDGVIEDVLGDVAEVRVALDHSRRVSLGDEMAEARPTPVEPLGVRSEQELHAAGNVRPGGLDEEMNVGRHQRERMHAPAHATRRSLEQSAETLAITVVEEERGAGNAPRAEVVVGAGQLDSMWSGHAGHPMALATS